MQIEVSTEINADIHVTFTAFSNLNFWQENLPDVLATETIYKDPSHQEFTMTVTRPSGPETVRGIWFLHNNEQIDLCQLTPPPGFKKMVGMWTFTQTGVGTKVTAVREFELHNDNITTNDIKLKGECLHRYLTNNMQLFKKAIESKYAN